MAPSMPRAGWSTKMMVMAWTTMTALMRPKIRAGGVIGPAEEEQFGGCTE